MQLSPEVLATLTRHNEMIQRANARIAQLEAVGQFGGAREMGQGVEITIIRPSFKGRHYRSRSYEIITPKE
jgi:hypothetical protein